MKIDPELLIREPFINFSGISSEEIRYHTSPNENYFLVVSHCWEYRMGSNACLFHLLNRLGNIVEDFSPHTTNGIHSWSDDSHYLAIIIGERNRGILIVDLILHQFSFIRSMCNYFRLHNNAIHFIIPDHQLESLNTDKVLGGRTNELPRVKYIKPSDIVIQMNTLTFHSKDKLEKIDETPTEIGQIKLEPVEDGFWPFYGNFPKNTWEGFNGREFEVYQLEAFAKYGDEQSIKWLNEIKSMSSKKYNKWVPVAYYLGNRARE